MSLKCASPLLLILCGLYTPAGGQDSSGKAAAEALKKRLSAMVIPMRAVPGKIFKVSRPKVCAIPLLNAPVNPNASIQRISPPAGRPEPTVSVPAPSCDDAVGFVARPDEAV